ncbi:hypothetical protein A6E15_19440 [Natrinema saccharevitans]|uniref:Uncharacterized protein n=1 Tax=Natrinema saccharevitans TaxID=301967 RepID=A0A1S8ARI4_9EURY|nr:hypothetical protein [Natrinema saccharevitans]OLZ39053.1 hypothetical protein A6E15_18995 [Natrinema saccharevitans]OLZ39139.1 hypothetical protein A6E15_19440 [Natrinema saccharevitans]
MNDRPVLVTPPMLARTYSGRAYEDPWDLVTDYQRVLEYTGEHPNASPGGVASALDLPRGRVRPWIDDGAIPHPVRGIQTAESRGWVPLTEISEVFDPINRLVAWVCSRGTIKPETYGPYVRIESSDDRERFESLVTQLGLEAREHRTDDSLRSTELTIRDDGAVLGRLLTCLDAPTDDDTRAVAPQYLIDVSEEAQREFARVYLENRAVYWEFNDRWLIDHQNRSDRYRRSLATFFQTLGAEADVHEDAVSVDDYFVSELGIEH